MEHDADTDHLDPRLKRAFDIYIDNIMRGCSQYESILRAGFLPNHAQEWIRKAETNPYVIKTLAERIKGLKASDFWSSGMAMLKLRQMSDDVTLKESVRLAAMKELNVICGITVADENGKTKARRTMADFYNEEGLVYPTMPERASAADPEAPKPPTHH